MLGCERIDHGYFVLEDPALVARVRDEGVPFTCISTTSRRSWQSWRRRSIARMVEEGLAVVLASDDPAMFPTSLAREYAVAAGPIGLSAAQLVEISRRSLDAAWVDDARRAELSAVFRREIDDLTTTNGDS